MQKILLSLSLLVLTCTVAMARPRDEVMINVYRCAGHPSTNVWLDCYYGAAQPQRAALGLAPAPAAQVQLVQAPAAPGVPRDLAARDAVIASAARCGSVSGERPWLDCYYAAANPVRALLGLKAVPGVAPMTPAQAPGVASRGDEGLFDGMFGKREVLAVSRMASYKFTRNGVFTVTLENGETWQQLDGDSNQAHWTRPARDYAVTISKGAFKSLVLTVKGNRAIYKVRRLS